jgi:hypothetical protein
MSAEQTTTSLKPTRGSFVRGLPLNMPIEEVIERGREAGLELQPSDIHSTRYYMRQAAAAEAARKSAVTQQLQLGPGFIGQAAKAAEAQQASGEEAEANGIEGVERRSTNATRNKRALKHAAAAAAALDDQLRVLVLRLGTDRTRAIIAELEALADRIARER